MAIGDPRTNTKEKSTCVYINCFHPESPCTGACLKDRSPKDYFNGANLATDQRQQEEDLICEALVDEMRRGGRWIAIVNAWQALLQVRRMGESMRVERDYLAGASDGGTQRA